MKKLLLFILCIIIFTACSNKTKISNSKTNELTAQINISEESKISSKVTNNQVYDIVQDGIITFDDANFGHFSSEIQAEPSKYDGKEVLITGFVYKKPEFNKNQFKVARMQSSGCAADAFVYGLMVETENATDFEKDQWVTVKGTLVVTSYIDPNTNIKYEQAYIQPKSIEKIENRPDYYLK